MADGFDFSNDKETAEMWEDIYDDADFWKKISEPEIVTEFRNFTNKISAFYKELEKMVEDNSYEKTQQLLDDLTSTRMGSDGWIGTFHDRNRGYFPASSADYSRPPYVTDPAEQKQYDMVIQYYQDLQMMTHIRQKLNTILLQLRLQDGFQVMRLVENFDEGGFDKNTYEDIEHDIKEINTRVNMNWDLTETIASKAKKYYEENQSKLGKSALNEGYRKARLQDYLDDAKDYAFYEDSFNSDSNGNFSVKPSVLSKMEVIDKYTRKVADLENVEDAMKKTIEDCNKVYTQYIQPFEKLLKTSAGIDLCANLHFLQDKIKWFATEALEVYKKFREPASDAPYCFMKRMSAIDEIKPEGWMSPERSDPRDNGTRLASLYKSAAAALTNHCKNFVYYHGHQELR